MAVWYTIAGIDDVQFPPDHPGVIKFYDRQSAQSLLDMYLRLGCKEFEACYVAEYVKL